MRRILFIATLLVAFFSTFTDYSTTQAQSMAAETIYDAYDQTKDGKNSYWEPCPKCGEFIGGHTEAQYNNNVKLHNEMKHPEFSDGEAPGVVGGESGTGTGGSGSSSGSGGTAGGYSNVVNVSSVASAMQSIGVCGYSWFMDEFDAYYRFGWTDCVGISAMDSFIRSRFYVQKGYTYERAKRSGRPFILIYKTSSDGKYGVLTNRNSSYYNGSGFLYVF